MSSIPMFFRYVVGKNVLNNSSQELNGGGIGLEDIINYNFIIKS